MIALHRLNGERIAVNPDLLEWAEETPETVIKLTTGARYVVADSLEELVEQVARYRAAILARGMAERPEGPLRA